MTTSKNRTGTVRALSGLLTLMSRIGKETGHEDISLHQVKVLLFVALADAQDMPVDGREVSAHLGLSTSGVSRAVASLGEFGRGDRAGLKLVDTHLDLNDRRRKLLRLTRRGLEAIETIIGKEILHESLETSMNAR